MGFVSKEKIMMNSADPTLPSVLVLSQSEATCADVAQALAGTLRLSVESQVFDIGNLEDLMPKLPRSDFILMDVGNGSLEEIAPIEKLRSIQEGEIPQIVALLDRGSELGPVRAMRAGAADVLLRPLDVKEADEVFLRLSTAQKVRPLFSGKTHLGKTIVFLHTSGGAGGTTLAVNSAVALSSLSKKDGVCLIDLDIQFGAAGSLLDLSRSSRIEDFISDPSRLDGEMLETLTVSHKSGLRVLTTPRFPMPLDALDEEGVSHLLYVAKRKYAFTVVDLPMTVTSWTAPVLQSADVIYLVLELSVPSAHRTRRFLELLQNEGISRLPIKIVANRQGSKKDAGVEVTLSKFAKAVGRSVDYTIPNDFSLISLSHGQGRAAVELKPKSKFSKDLKQMLSKELGDNLFGEKERGRFSFGRR